MSLALVLLLLPLVIHSTLELDCMNFLEVSPELFQGTTQGKVVNTRVFKTKKRLVQ